MENNFLAFRTFPTLEQAVELAASLNQHGIKTQLGDNIPSFDVSFASNTFQHQYEVQISSSEFDRAEQVLSTEYENLREEVDESHYLYSFSDEELFDVLAKPDEWNKLDYKLAREILGSRGHNIDSARLNALKQTRMEELAKPEKSRSFWIAIGYIWAISGGAIGIVIGYLLYSSKKTLPNGDRVYLYNQTDRMHGERMFLIGIVVFIVAVLWRIFG
jgi:Superfamily I DNA and RNA helicases